MKTLITKLFRVYFIDIHPDCTPYSKGLTDNISSNLSITKSALKTISALNINLANYIKLWLQKEYKIIDQPLC